MKYWAICKKCGLKKGWTIKDEMITVHKGVCPICKRKTTRIPIRDFYKNNERIIKHWSDNI